MRSILCTFPILLTVVHLALGQEHATETQLQKVLRSWEKALTSLVGLSMECERTTRDKVFETTEKYRGTAKMQRTKQGMHACLEMFKETNGKLQPDRFEKFLFTGNTLYDFAAADKVIRKIALPSPKAGEPTEDFLSLLFGKKSADVLERYQLSFVPADSKYYFYIKVLPRFDRDKADFSEAYVALYQSNFLTAMIHFRQPNGNEVTWRFRNIQINPQLSDKDFAAPEPPPAGWQLKAQR